jgi:hypothetical protein
LQTVKSLFALAFGGYSPAPGTGIQRLAIPHTFNEGLGLREAAVAVTQAFLRIMLSCLLFAFWGALVLRLWDAIGNHFWRWAMLLPLLALFLSLFLALMIAISAAAKAVTPKRA